MTYLIKAKLVHLFSEFSQIQSAIQTKIVYKYVHAILIFQFYMSWYVTNYTQVYSF